MTETIETTGKFDFITGTVTKKYPPGTLVHFEKEVPSDPESRWEIICTDAKESFRRVFLSESIGGYIDVGNGCWRPLVLVTSLRCW